MFCRFCGKEAQEGQSFCPYCGKKDDTVANNQPISVGNSVYTVNTMPMQQAAQPVMPMQQAVQPLPVEQKKKKSKLWIVIVAVILVAAIVAGVVFLPGMFKKGENGSKRNDEIVDNYDKNESVADDGNSEELVTVWLVSKIVVENHEYNELNNGTYKYDDNGNLCEEIWIYSEGWEERYIYMYNSDGKMSEEIRYEDEEESWRCTYEYDAKEKELEGSRYYENGEDRCIRKYDGSKLTEERWYCDGEESECYIYKYDDKDSLIEKSCYYNDGESYSYTYKYVNNGNKTEVICYEGDEKVRTRTIEYISVKVLPEQVENIKIQQNYIVSFF